MRAGPQSWLVRTFGRAHGELEYGLRTTDSGMNVSAP